MALSSKLNAQQKTPEEIGEILDGLGKLIDRTKVMYEQYFMGIQKMPPSQLHRDIERRIREVTQMSIRNTGLRFRFATLTQKFGSYNTYWKRTMRKIERGEYIRDLARVGRDAARRGVEIPEELLAKVPERTRKRILRDREKMAARMARDADREQSTASKASKTSKAPGNTHKLSLDDDLDLDSIFDNLTQNEPKTSSEPDAGDFADSPGTYSRTQPGLAGAPARRAPAPPLPVRPPTRERATVRPTATSATSATSAQKATRRASAPATPKVAPPPGMNEREGRALYEKYAKARRLVGDKRKVTYEQLMNKLGRQAPKIMRDHNAVGVGFNVVIKGDRVVLKAKPKKA